MPSFGLGVWQAPLGQCKNAVLHALRCGYRHIDTAEIYGNEQDVGDALALFLKERPDVQREDVWVTTKFFPRNGAGRAAVVRACRDSLRKLRLEYVDLYLIHAPHTRERLEQYRALEALRAEGLCRSIGVSNYGIHHLQELLAVCAVPPCVNQVRATSAWCPPRHRRVESHRLRSTPSSRVRRCASSARRRAFSWRPTRRSRGPKSSATLAWLKLRDGVDCRPPRSWCGGAFSEVAL